MKQYIIKRLLWLIPIMLLISFITFFLMYLSPGDPVIILLSQDGNVPDDATIAIMREQLGLNDSVWVQYGRWLNNLCHGDLGTSIFTKHPVIQDIGIYFPNTMRLAILAMIATLAISIPLGIFTAVHENTFVDYVIRVFTFTAGALPGFFAALMLIYLFGVKLRWLPTVSSGNAKGIIMPTMALALTLSASYIRQIRAEIIDELGENYIRMMRARGIKERMILYGGALKSVMPSILTLAGMRFGALLGGTSIIEIVCTYQGLGRLAVNSITNRDYPLMQGFVLMMASIYVLVNLVVDIAHAYADPRVMNRILAENGGRKRNEKK